MKKTVLLIVLLLANRLLAQNIQFEQANEAYRNKQYNQAIDSYNRVISTNTLVAPEVYFNLANAYYKTNKIAPSIYYYEKALQQQPNDKAILENLKLAKRMQVDKFDIIAKPFLTKVQDIFTSFLTVDTWAYLTVAFAVLFLLFFILYFLKRKRSYFTLFWMALVVVLYSFFSANYQLNKAKNNHFAIVFNTEVSLQKEPKLTADEIVKIHEGEKVKVLVEDKNWSKIKLTDGRIGWMPSESFRKL